MKELKFENAKKLKESDLLNNSVYLIYGESFLYKKILNNIVDSALSNDEKELNFESYDNSTDEISDIYESLSTYSFFSDKKVVHLSDSKIFYSKKDDSDLLEKSETAFEKGELRKSSKFFLNYLSLQNKNLESKVYLNNLTKENPWAAEILTFCSEKDLKVVKAEDDSRIICDIVENMLENRIFIITTEKINKKNIVYKSILKNGVVIDCSVSKSGRKDDKKKQDDLLINNAKEKLKQAGKKINNDALSKLINMTGFKLEILNDNVEKLINFSGKRDTVTIDDVNSVLKRTRTDPIFEITSALSERKINESLFYLKSLLKENYHPLQIMSAITNQIRRLILARDFIDSSYGKSWNSSYPYNVFRDRVMPYVEEFDRKTVEIDKSTKDFLSGKKASDLILAKNPKSPYPVYLLLKNGSGFTAKHLYSIHCEIAKYDRAIKTTGFDAVMAIEKVIFEICR